MTATEEAGKFLTEARRRAALRALFVAALVVSVGVNVLVTVQALTRAQDAMENTVTFAQQVQDACADGGLLVDGRDLCNRADEVVEDPAAPPVPQPVQDGATDEQVAAGVATWFATHDLSLTPGYSSSLQATVARYLSRNPPPAGKDGKDAPEVTDQRIAAVVATYLMAHPPADGTDGTDGADGRGLVTASLDGCHVVFTYTDGTADRIGPICGTDGTDGDKGAKGDAGVGYKDVECLDPENDWKFTYTDGTVQILPGPCRVEPIIPTPEEG